MSVQEHSTGFETNRPLLPNNPSEYIPTDHFMDNKKWRHISGEIIREVIETGIVKPAKDGCYKFVKIVNGFEWWFVVKHIPGDKNKLITAYIPEFMDDKEKYDRYIK